MSLILFCLSPNSRTFCCLPKGLIFGFYFFFQKAHFSFCKGPEVSHHHYSQKHLIAELLAVRSWTSTHVFKRSEHSVPSNVTRAWKCLSWGWIIVIILNKAKEVTMLQEVGEWNCISYWIVKIQKEWSGSLGNKYQIFIMATIKSCIATNERNSSLPETGRGWVWGNGNHESVTKALHINQDHFK